jgi:hypothetical protein
VTAVIGHVLTIDFPAKFQSWDLDPVVLFDAPVVSSWLRVRGLGLRVQGLGFKD